MSARLFCWNGDIVIAFQYAYRFSLLIFSVVALRGSFDGSSLSETLPSALIFAVLGYVVGYLIGEISRHLIEEATEYELTKMFQSEVSGTISDSAEATPQD